MDNNRNYTDVGLISKHSSLNIQDVTDGKFFLLVPTTTLPATKGAPATVDKTVLTDGSMTQVEGLQSNDQKTYTFNYHRDNIRQLKKYKGKKLTFIERNPDNTGERFIGTLAFGRTDVSVNGIVQGNIFITVESADDDPIDDVRDLIKPTAIITNALEDVNLTGTGSVVVPIETSEGATVAVASASTSIATATYADGKLTVTGVAAGSTFVNLTVSKTGEATSYRSIAVNVISE